MNNPFLTESHVRFYDFEYVARTNSKGLRTDEIPPKSKCVYRVLAIGDSYAYGWGVNREDTWEQRIEGLFRDAGRAVKVINGGMAGGSPIKYAQRAEFLIPDLTPDLVLVCILGAATS
jgi:lysophospholipase L1-like esterase